MNHGTRSSYVHAHCRCDACRAANAAYYRARRRPRAQYDAERHQHPSLNCYKKHRCRCPGCRRHNTYHHQRHAMLRAWNTTT